MSNWIKRKTNEMRTKTTSFEKIVEEKFLYIGKDFEGNREVKEVW